MHVRRVVVDGIELAMSEAGAGGRPLLLVHGFTGAKEDFAEIHVPLADAGWHAAALDLRGHGASDRPTDPAGYDLAGFTRDVLGVADALGWDRFTLVGHSMGGAIAQRLALDHPRGVDALVLLSTFHGPLDVDADLVALGVAIVEQGGMPALASALEARRANDEAALAARRRMEDVRPGYGVWAEAKLLACAPEMWLAMAPRFPDWPDLLDELAGLDVPTLVVVGSEDATMRAHCERLASAIPGARLEVLEGIRHSPQLEAPKETLAVLESFLAALR